MEWLQERMRRHLAEAPWTGLPNSNVLALRPQPSAEEVGGRAVDLAERAVRHIRNVEQEAAERHARAEMLARNAIEKLNKAEERVNTAESARREASARVDEMSARLRDVELQLERTAASAAVAQTKAATAEQRMRDAERRATEAEDTIKRIEKALRTLLSEERLSACEIAA